MNNKKDGKKVRGYRDILYEVKDQVAWITINRPRVMNAFREQTLDEMIDAFKSTREDPSISGYRGWRKIVFRRRGFFRDEAFELDQRKHVERSHAGACYDYPGLTNSSHRYGQWVLHGRRP